MARCFDAAHVGWRFPVALQRESTCGESAEFAFYGPTCDDMDYMAGPFVLPADIKAGDYIEVGMLGAYGCAMRTEFKRLWRKPRTSPSRMKPMASLYTRIAANDAGNVVAFGKRSAN